MKMQAELVPVSQEDDVPVSHLNTATTRPVLQVASLSKSYGHVQVLHDISLQINPGEIIGLVGPNGAGKTTLMETVQGMHAFDCGRIHLLDEDIGHGLSAAVKQRLGVAPQFFSLPALLRVEEILALYQVLYRDALSVDELLTIVALEAQRKKRFSRLSGGQKRRLALALALAGRPKLLLLDEPTGDLDPQSRRYIWRHIIDNARQSGMGVLIATHQMDEAEALCDRVMIINHGKVLENASPQQLINRYCPGHHIRFSVGEAFASRFLETFSSASRQDDDRNSSLCHLHLPAERLAETLPKLLALSELLRCELIQLQVSKNTLEDVFITLTGEALRD